jgi:putative membrane protein
MPRRSPLPVATAAALLLVACATAGAHQAEGPPTLASAWSLSPWILVPLAALALGYAGGLARLWRRAGVGRGVDGAQAGAFGLGMVVLVLALVWPLDALGGWSLAAHMAQHMLLLALAPPLLLAGRPWAVVVQALPARLSRALHRAGGPASRALLPALVAASVLHAAVMLLWHLPAATQWALRVEWVHWTMHGSFLVAGLWFWSALLRCLRDPKIGAGAGVMALLAVMIQMGLVGGLLTFSRRSLYPVYELRAPALGLDPLGDQQLAGLLMWVPACLPYLFGALWLMWRALRDPQARAGQRTGSDGGGW